VTDITAGILAAMATLAAYTHRLKTGEGQMVDTSLFEAGIVQTYWQSAIALATGAAPGPMGSGHPLSAPYQAFATADGWITIGAANQGNWLRLVDVLEAGEVGADPRFADNDARMRHLPELEAALAPYFRERTSADWLARLENAGVPAGPVFDVSEMHRDPQTLAREMVVEVAHTTLGPVKTIGLPVKFSGTPGAVTSGAPVYGEHTRSVLREHGFSAEDIDRLAATGVVAAADRITP
jgi:crotonobetainyl-CoA:carnitine CoA-transferase CaiB-like acyl-CoA transferase